MTSLRTRVAAIALSLTLSSVGASCWTHHPGDAQKAPVATSHLRRMPGGHAWLMENLNVNTDGSYCYADAPENCRRYGRLYTWSAARLACASLGKDWRLPTHDDWRLVAGHFGGVGGASADTGRSAYRALVFGGTSGFNARLGGGRVPDGGQYARLEVHGFYWTASENDSATAWFYNFASGSRALYGQRDGEKQRAFSVRCVRD